MEIVGFCRIDPNATSCNGAKNPSEFIGKICKVMEFNSEGDVLVLNPELTALAMFDKKDIAQSFECSVSGGQYICPPKLDHIAQMLYVSKCMSRKGGYNDVLANMVIGASLLKGEFTDSFLWQNQ